VTAEFPRVFVIFSLFSVILLMPVSSQIMSAENAYGQEPLSITSPLVKDLGGRFVDQVSAGEEFTLVASVLSGGEADQPFVVLVDVRDGDDRSIHIGWVEGVAKREGKVDVSLPWVAQVSGTYKVRTFLISDFKKLQVLSSVKTSSVDVKPSARAEIKEIANFASKWDKVNYVVWFSFLDDKMNAIGYDGKAALSITDATGEVRYSASVQVTKNDFIMYERQRGDALKVLSYVWKFPATAVNKGIGQGVAKLTFTAADSSVFTSETPIELRQLSGEDIIRAYDYKYQLHGTDVDDTVVEGNFKVILDRVGHFTHLSNATSGEEVTHFRADFTITNLVSENQPSPARIYLVDDKGNRYDEVAYVGAMRPGAEIKAFSALSGYKVFNDLREDALWVKIVIVGLNAPDDILELHVTL
jgi:hypothetical protein